MSALFALATSLLWGLADFGGGLLTRRTPALTVVVVSQTIAVTVLGAIVVTTGGWSEAGPQLWFAAAAGVVGPAALGWIVPGPGGGPRGGGAPGGPRAITPTDPPDTPGPPAPGPPTQRTHTPTHPPG
ncbi:hypothetical protein ACFXEZ_12210, partial [Streptomyces hygroscopicus]